MGASVFDVDGLAGARPDPSALVGEIVRRHRALLLVALFLVALYWPSAIGGEISGQMLGTQAIVTVAFLFVLATAPHGLLGTPSLVLALLVNGLLWLFTMVGPGADATLGAAVLYGAASLLFCLRISPDGPLRGVIATVSVVSLLNLGVGGAMIVQLPPIHDLASSYYDAFWSGLVPFMLSEGKPVLTFGTHSVAAFFCYLFFLVHHEHHLRSRRLLPLLLAAGFCVLLAYLRSTSAVILLVAAGVRTVLLACRRDAPKTGLLGVVAGVGALLFVRPTLFSEGVEVLRNVVEEPSMGLLARYGSGGMLASTLAYIAEHPFQPVGFAHLPELMFGDSGFVVCTLRGSIVLPFVFYGLFVRFILANVPTRRLAWELIGLFLAFEVGFTNLIYLRTVGTLPLVLAALDTRPRARTYAP